MSSPTWNEPVPQRSSYKFHPVRGIVWAAFWGTPVAAGVVMAINYARSGQGKKAWVALLVGLLATAALFFTIFMIPDERLDKIPSLVFLAPQLILAYLCAKVFQSRMIDDHEASGGFVASGWPSVGIGFLCLPLVLAMLFGVVYLTEPSMGTHVAFGEDEIYYSGDATESDARVLASALREAEFFGTGGASVALKKESGQFTVSFVLVDDAWHEAETVDALKLMMRDAGSDALTLPLTMQLCDEYFEIKKTVTVE